MKLILAKVGVDILIGEYRGRSSVGIPDAPLENPMSRQEVEMVQASAIDPRKRQQVAGFRLVPLPCSEIVFTRVDYFGEVRKTDPVYTTYYKVLEAVKQSEADPLMVAQ
jgi:hypothetical protein